MSCSGFVANQSSRPPDLIELRRTRPPGCTEHARRWGRFPWVDVLRTDAAAAIAGLAAVLDKFKRLSILLPCASCLISCTSWRSGAFKSANFECRDAPALDRISVVLLEAPTLSLLERVTRLLVLFIVP